jgi:hypothetical protein
MNHAFGMAADMAVLPGVPQGMGHREKEDDSLL